MVFTKFSHFREFFFAKFRIVVAFFIFAKKCEILQKSLRKLLQFLVKRFVQVETLAINLILIWKVLNSDYFSIISEAKNVHVSFAEKQHKRIIYAWSDNAFKDTVVNRTWQWKVTWNYVYVVLLPLLRIFPLCYYSIFQILNIIWHPESPRLWVSGERKLWQKLRKLSLVFSNFFPKFRKFSSRNWNKSKRKQKRCEI